MDEGGVVVDEEVEERVVVVIEEVEEAEVLETKTRRQVLRSRRM